MNRSLRRVLQLLKGWDGVVEGNNVVRATVFFKDFLYFKGQASVGFLWKRVFFQVLGATSGLLDSWRVMGGDWELHVMSFWQAMNYLFEQAVLLGLHQHLLGEGFGGLILNIMTP